jgi:hypothetical protein
MTCSTTSSSTSRQELWVLLSEMEINDKQALGARPDSFTVSLEEPEDESEGGGGEDEWQQGSSQGSWRHPAQQSESEGGPDPAALQAGQDPTCLWKIQF